MTNLRFVPRPGTLNIFRFGNSFIRRPRVLASEDSLTLILDPSRLIIEGQRPEVAMQWFMFDKKSSKQCKQHSCDLEAGCKRSQRF